MRTYLKRLHAVLRPAAAAAGGVDGQRDECVPDGVPSLTKGLNLCCFFRFGEGSINAMRAFSQ